MTLLFRNSRFLDHNTGNHPERAMRLRAVEVHLDHTWLAAQCRQPSFSPASRAQLELVHTPDYIDRIAAISQSGGAHLDGDTVCSAASYEVAQLAAGAVVEAVQQVIRGDDSTAFCLVRPPGHHALASQAMGFCLFNNIAVGAAFAVEELELDRVLIIDFDVHHGNGTQDMFYRDPRVGFLSIHRWPFYPGTGGAEERGEGDGLGTTLNLPIASGTSRGEYMSIFSTQLQTFADRIRPQLVLISAGFDAHRSDPLGDLGLETEDFTVMTDLILDVADVHAGGRVVSVLEGGYNLPVLTHCVEDHLVRLVDGRK